jgi:hypothetical protein
MRVTIEVGDGQELCYLLDREIDAKRSSRDVLAAMPPEQRAARGRDSYGKSLKRCDEDIATYTQIRESLAQALDFENLQIAYVEPKKRTTRRRRSRVRDH